MKTRTPVLVKSLVALAILQALVLAVRGDGPFRKRSASPASSDVSPARADLTPARADPTHAPSDLSAVVAVDADGEEQPLGEGGPALAVARLEPSSTGRLGSTHSTHAARSSMTDSEAACRRSRAHSTKRAPTPLDKPNHP